MPRLVGLGFLIRRDLPSRTEGGLPMPVELLHRPAPADENLPLAPPAPQQADNDDWSGVFCCSAMRPRNSAESQVLSAEWVPTETEWLEG